MQSNMSAKKNSTTAWPTWNIRRKCFIAKMGGFQIIHRFLGDAHLAWNILQNSAWHRLVARTPFHGRRELTLHAESRTLDIIRRGIPVAKIAARALQWEEFSSRKRCSQLPTAQPVALLLSQRWRHLQLQHTTQLQIYADLLPFIVIFKLHVHPHPHYQSREPCRTPQILLKARVWVWGRRRRGRRQSERRGARRQHRCGEYQQRCSRDHRWRSPLVLNILPFSCSDSQAFEFQSSAIATAEHSCFYRKVAVISHWRCTEMHLAVRKVFVISISLSFCHLKWFEFDKFLTKRWSFCHLHFLSFEMKCIWQKLN